ncbi:MULTISPECIES: ATP-dependent RNA helicase HrpA [unclassified Roseateles]|uniref:ATP-dependent RNA helicase HrpA n=1 Tax=unclassified Roseateles TaxID=2626991 RepID=UPI0006F8B0F3|nr:MULTISPECIES: ATP-dependent RNA helicase HrpA [unclassified Roseateles]KQW44689.1 ATP-dependent helicase [Pelomonas sp. Root405]KRA70048.1 ATP-dependent helicase [Pelomonas sp. Root662]
MNSERPESRLPQPALSISFPESLPVSARRDEIAHAMAEHQVVIVCGETGSGKTTQLPKIALAMGRGRINGGGLIGHTQPRRIAASSVAKRIAEELKTPLGDVVGYKVRFQDRLAKTASVKLMTDGILLAETQSDPLLKAYDTLIIDEAHERSLNIDFLLGYLRELLPRRPDLKIVVTSATIDADRFARHFESSKGPAPVLTVSGRLYPVEQRYRPFEESREYDLNNAITDAVDELWREGGGDVLVFLPGEREIREAAEALRKHHPPGVEVLPLFARLSQAEQDKVFEPHGQRRIVLATNVAETSLTVPGIRYVIDPGLARVKRYSYRNKVEQLLIEPVSQAASNQRAGRCGRVSNGICIRLYSEKEFNERPKFTDPEILRSSLAGVILRMKSLHLGEVERFPFLEPPRPKAIADGYQLLAELGATDDDNELTPLGKELSRLPLDPRVGRMILEAKNREALSEVLVIASALSGQDVRDRPMEAAQAADEKHKKFDDEKSEFSGYLKLWKWLEDSKGGGAEHKLSNRRHEQLLRENFISPRRVREWRDVYSQLLTVVAEHGWRLNQSPATYEQLHLSMLAGLLGNIGQKSDDEDWYLGARGIKFYRHPGAHLSKKPGRWIVAAELVDTSRLYGRGIANIEPQWLPPIAGHLIKTQLLEPHWEKKAAEVVALERATLYGIVLYSNKRVNFGRVDPRAAREIFIREGLVNDDLPDELVRQLPFLGHNRRQIAKVEALEHKSRRQDVLVDDELIYAFYDDKLPANVFSGATLLKWWREASKSDDKLLQLSQDELMRHEAAGVTSEAFPKVIRLGGVDCAATYLHEPGDARDGLTVTVPIFALNQVSEERAEWLVPGMLAAKVTALLKSLHQKPRARLTPLPDFVAEFVELQPFCQGGLVDTLLRAVKDRTQLAVQRNDFKLEQLPPHLFMNFRVVDEHGRQLGQGRQLAALKAELGGQARSAFQALAALKLPAAEAAKPAAAPVAGKGIRAEIVKPAAPARDAAQAYTDWTFGELPELLEVRKGGQTLIGFPALIDKGAHVEIEVFDEPEVAAAKHRAGLRRLIALQLKEPLKFLEKNIPDLQRMSVLYMGLGTAEELRDQIIGVALDLAFLADPLPTDPMSFKKRIEEGRSRLNLIAQEVARAAHAVLQELANAARKLKDSRPAKDVGDDVTAQLQRLVPKRFALDTPWAQLQHLPRYLKAITTRLDKLRADPARDARLMGEVKPLEQRYTRRLADLKGVRDARLDDFRWQLEELRVSLFAQELRTPQPVSVKRLDKVWSQLS